MLWNSPEALRKSQKRLLSKSVAEVSISDAEVSRNVVEVTKSVAKVLINDAEVSRNVADISRSVANVS